jgi:hypothetical protein
MNDNIPASAYKDEDWRIKQVTIDLDNPPMGFAIDLNATEYDVKGGFGLPCGLGYVSWLAVLTVIAGVIFLTANIVIKNNDDAVKVVYLGFLMIPLGIWFQHRCVLKRSKIISAMILDSQLKFINKFKQRKVTWWGVRVLVEFQLNGRKYQVTPGYRGYEMFKDYAKAEQTYQKILKRKTLKIRVDPETPWQTYFVEWEKMF